MPQLPSVGQPPWEAEIVPASDRPLYEQVLEWLNATLAPSAYPKPLRKRLAVLLCGLLGGERATLGAVTSAVDALDITPAKPESIARRLQRCLQDVRLDPGLLPRLLGPLLPRLLGGHLQAHAASLDEAGGHRERFVGVPIVLDESSQEDHVHLLVAGVPIGGVVLPLAVRTWAQTLPLPEGEYWVQVMGLLYDIQAMLPPELRDHVLLTADRAYGVPRMLDVLMALDWDWLLRVPGQALVRLPDGRCRSLRELASAPGTQWSSGFGSATEGTTPEVEPLAVFKAAGWRRSQVVAVWAAGEPEPWLLLTSLPGTLARVAEYAQRWAIERLFLSWKSHGWDIEASGVHEPARLGRLLTGLALATLWRLAMALPTAVEHLRDLAGRAGKVMRQLPLRGFTEPCRPWAAKYSLLTLGRQVATKVHLAVRTPALCWSLPNWEGRTWRAMCRHVATVAPRQFSAFP